MKAHKGITGNEEADQAAREGAKNLNTKLKTVKTLEPGGSLKDRIDRQYVGNGNTDGIHLHNTSILNTFTQAQIKTEP